MQVVKKHAKSLVIEMKPGVLVQVLGNRMEYRMVWSGRREGVHRLKRFDRVNKWRNGSSELRDMPTNEG